MSWTTWFFENQVRFQGEFLPNEPLSKHTYYKIGGPATLLLIPETLESLSWIQEGLKLMECDFNIIGLGSNLLISDKGLDSLVIKTSKINSKIELLNETTIRVGAAVTVTSLLRVASQSGWAGLEWMTGIPGNVGGVVSMNAGTHLGEAKNSLIRVETFHLTRGLEIFTDQQIRYEYRKNLFLEREHLITQADWRIARSNADSVKTLIQETLARRKSTQPLEYPSCGSVFKNPAGKKAWEVLDALNLRGHQIGQAQFSKKHPNFIVNLKGALASDVWALIVLAKERAHTELGIELQEEVKYLK